MNHPAFMSVAFLSLAALAPAQVTHQGVWNIANVSYADNVTPLITDFNDGTRAQYASLVLPGYDAWAFSTFGIERSYLSMAPTTDGLFSGGTLAAFDDRLVISRAGMAGLHGVARVSYMVTGSYGIGGAASFANLEITSRLITVGTVPTVTVDHFNRNSAGTGTGVDFLGVRQTALVNYIFDTPFDLELQIQSNGMVNTFGGGRGNLFVDLSHTVLWGGIEDVFVTDALGNPVGELVTDWSVTSDSLSNYAVPFSVAVPEPATYGMISVALLAAAVLVRRRRDRANKLFAVVR